MGVLWAPVYPMHLLTLCPQSEALPAHACAFPATSRAWWLHPMHAPAPHPTPTTSAAHFTLYAPHPNRGDYVVSEAWPAGNFRRRHSNTTIRFRYRLSDCGLALAFIRPSQPLQPPPCKYPIQHPTPTTILHPHPTPIKPPCTPPPARPHLNHAPAPHPPPLPTAPPPALHPPALDVPSAAAP